MAVVGTLLLTSAVSAVAAVAFLYAGRAFWRTRPKGQRGPAARAFVTYWWASAAYHLLTAALGLLGAFALTPFDLFLAARYVAVVLAGTCLTGLAFYVLYLFTGRRAWLWPTIAFYAAVGLSTMYYLNARRPIGVLVEPWKVDLLYSEPLSGVATAIVLMLLLPQIVGALAYGTLAWRVREPEQRFRVGVIATAIFVWFASALAAEISREPFWQFVTRPGIGLAVAALVVLAYSPPAFLHKRFPPSEETALAREEERLRKEARHRAMAQRARELL